MPIFPQQNRRGNSDTDGNKSEHTVCPSPPQLLIHAWRKKGETEPSQRSDKRRGSARRCCIPRVCVDDVGLCTLETDDETGCKDEGADVGAQPVGSVIGSPAVDEKTDGAEEAAWKHEGDAIFGNADRSAVATFERAVDSVVDGGADLEADDEADTKGEVVQGCQTDRLPVDILPEEGKGGQDEIHEPIQIRSVQG